MIYITSHSFARAFLQLVWHFGGFDMKLRYFLYLFFVLFSTSSFASTYTWRAGGYDWPAGSPASLCAQYLDYNKNIYGPTFSYKSSILSLSDTYKRCVVSYRAPNWDEGYWSDTNMNMSREGDSCPEGENYNAEKGVCAGHDQANGSLCTDQSGATSSNPNIYDWNSDSCKRLTEASNSAMCAYMGGKPFGVDIAVKGVIDKSGNATAPPTFVPSVTNCQMETVTTSKCIVGTDGSATCQVTAKYTGAEGSGAKKVTDAQCGVGEVCNELVPETSNEEKPCTYVSDSSGNLTCVSEKEIETQGTQNCGTFNGKYDCYTTKPTKNGISIATVVKTVENADGTKVTTKTDQATKTTCSDINTCSTTTSTTTTVIHTNSSGATTSTTSTCTGKCSSTGTGLSTGDVDGDGSDSGEEGSGGSGVTGPELEDIDGYGDAVTAYYGRIKGSPIVSAVTSITVPSGGSCPVYNMTTEYTGTIDTREFCNLAPQLLIGLRYVFLAIWAFMAIRIVMSA